MDVDVSEKLLQLGPHSYLVVLSGGTSIALTPVTISNFCPFINDNTPGETIHVVGREVVDEKN